jgi:uncharacterized RDD family membrane protein YckC
MEGKPPDDRPESPPPAPGMPSVPAPGVSPESPQQPPQQQPPPPGPESPDPGPQSPAPGPQSPAAPSYSGPVPPGGWQQPVGTQPPGQPPAPRPIPGPLASWGIRFGAWIIDGLVLLIPGGLLFFLIVGGALGISGGDDDAEWGAAIALGILWLFLFALISLLYAPLLMIREGQRNGQTWGKQLLGIRVVRDSGELFGFGAAALREIVLKQLAVGIASAIIPFIPWLLDYLWPLWDDENRALHDIGASTHVITT